MTTMRSRARNVGLGVVVAALTVVSLRLALGQGPSYRVAAADDASTAPAPVEPAAAAWHPVIIRQPTAPKGVDAGVMDGEGKPILLACNTCHTVRPPNLDNRATTDLNEFHQGLRVGHGTIACAACHNPADGYTTLRSAEGKTIAYADMMQLCAQCHGTQYRDYMNGSHGGMTGYWDRSRGPRHRNHCIDCHDPHSPKFPEVMPVFAPNDRFPPRQGGHP